MAAGVGRVELVDLPEPACTPDGVKVEVKFTGICGTDIHVYHDRFRYYSPVILGHEFAGLVVETGAAVQGIKTGDRVAVLGSTMVRCGVCEYCTRGNYMFCPARRGMGHGVSGSFTKYVVLREDMCYRLPEGLSYEEAALTEAFASAVQAVEELTCFGVGETVLLSGPGPIGLLCLVLLAARGCKTIVAGTPEDRLRPPRRRPFGGGSHRLSIPASHEKLWEYPPRSERVGMPVPVLSRSGCRAITSGRARLILASINGPSSLPLAGVAPLAAVAP